MAAAPQKWTLKIELQGEVRRLRGWPELEAEPSVEALRTAVCKLFDLDLEQKQVLALKYHDDDGDLCTLVEASLPDALSFASQRGVLRVSATLKFSQESTNNVHTEGQVEEPILSSQFPKADIVSQAEPTPAEAGLPSQGADDDNAIWMCPTCDEANRWERIECNNCATARLAQFEADSPSARQCADPAKEAEPTTQFEPSVSEDFAEAQRNLIEQLSQASHGSRESLQGTRSHVDGMAASVSEHLAEAHRNVSEQVSHAHRNVSEQLSEAHGNVSEKLSEVQRIARDHLEVVGPHVAEGVSFFKQQVVEDFQSTSQDMHDAFGPNATEMSGKVRAVVGMAAGVIAAVRLAPVRATRLAVHSIAAVVGKNTSRGDADDVDERQTATSNADDASSAEFAHFKHQVENDFQSTRKEVQIVFNCILRETVVASVADCDQSATPHEPSSEQDTPLQQPPTLKTAIPAVVSTAVGGSVALCLAPLRAARFAVASLASASSPHVENEEPPRQ